MGDRGKSGWRVRNYSPVAYIAAGAGRGRLPHHDLADSPMFSLRKSQRAHGTAAVLDLIDWATLEGTLGAQE
ncbi:MAG: hypothetical protein R3E01_06160 [Pirellulaceae bacterium]|nr:hypothetical protein [Planctomycetales bacterium]